MLTRLKISGFKNLADVDIQFGPFTCIAGPNAAGKSNLFDAIQFLSALSDKTLIDAAVSIRNEGGKPSDLRYIFHHLGDKYAKEMSFETEMLISREGIDDLGQKAEASYTFLRYKVRIAYRMDETLPSLGGLELIEERLEHITKGDAPSHLKFPHNVSKWRKSVIHGRRTTPFISTESTDNKESRIIKLHQDGVKGRARTFSASNLPRTVLSSVNAVESPTALVARREMQSWRLLQLEPSSLREPDSFSTPPGLGSDGSHLAATLYYLSHKQSSNKAESWAYEQVTARLSELIDDCELLFIHRDAEREPRETRIEEIKKALKEVGAVPSNVCVIPVRMQEAWLLFNENAIRSAAGNRNGSMQLTIPPLSELEALPNPKEHLHNLLRQASGLHGRRLENFNVRNQVRRVTDFINDYSSLRELPAFLALEMILNKLSTIF